MEKENIEQHGVTRCFPEGRKNLFLNFAFLIGKHPNTTLARKLSVMLVLGYLYASQEQKVHHFNERPIKCSWRRLRKQPDKRPASAKGHRRSRMIRICGIPPPANPQCRLIHLNRKTLRILFVKRTPIRWVLVLKSALLKSSVVGLPGLFPKSERNQPAIAPMNELILPGIVVSYRVSRIAYRGTDTRTPPDSQEA